MFKLRVQDSDLVPVYMSAFSSGADLKSSQDMVIEPMQVARVPTGVWIEDYDPATPFRDGLGALGEQAIPELQVRARSGLAAKHNITLANGVGTIDADYREEICVLLINLGSQPFVIKRGDRIAQLVLNIAFKIPGLETRGTRKGGFGSTGT